MTIISDKIQTVVQATEDKQQSLGSKLKSRLKQETPSLTLEQEIAWADSNSASIEWPKQEETAAESFIRGGSDAVMGMGNLGYGIAAGVGAIAESTLGEGGFSTQFKEAAVNKYVEGQKEIAKGARTEDSIIYSYNQAKQGNIKALFDWTTHGLGYTSTQLATMLIGAGFIGKGIEFTGKNVVKQALSGMVDKEVNRMVAQGIVRGGQQIAVDLLHKQAVATVTKKIGMHTGMGTMATGMEFGVIMGGLAEQSTQRPEGEQVLSKEEIGKGLLATGAAGAAEYAEILLGIRALKGKLPGLSGRSRATKIGASAAQVAPAEAAQEFTQTVLEQWGQGQDTTTPEAINEQIEAAALGALGGGSSAAVGASVHGLAKKQIKPSEKKANKAISTPETQFGYKDKVNEVVESGDASKYNDPKKDTYSPGIELAAIKKKSMDEQATVADKVTTYEQGVEAVAKIVEQRSALAKKVKVIMNKSKAGTVTDEEVIKIDSLLAKMDALALLEPKAKTMLNSMKVDKAKAPELVEQLRTMVKDSNDEGVIGVVKEIFGTHGGAFLSELDGAAIDKMLSDPTATETTKILLGNVSKYIKAKGLADRVAGKTVSDVNIDVLEGSEGFLGIDDHLQSIAVATTKKTAETRLFSLQKFVDGKQLRADTFQSVYDTNVGNQPRNEAAFTQMDKYNAQAKKEGYRTENYDVGQNSTKMIKNMHEEAAALQAAVALGNTMVHGTTSTEIAATQASPPVQSGTQIPTTPKVKAKPVGTEQVGGDAPSTPKTSGVGKSQSVINEPEVKTPVTNGIDYDQIYIPDSDKFNEEDYTTPPTLSEDTTDVGSTPVAEAKPSTQDGTPETVGPTQLKIQQLQKARKILMKAMRFDETITKTDQGWLDDMAAFYEAAKSLPYYNEKISNLLGSAQRSKNPIAELIKIAALLTQEVAYLKGGVNTVLTASEHSEEFAQNKDNAKLINPIREFGLVVKEKMVSIFNRPGTVMEILLDQLNTGKDNPEKKAALSAVMRFTSEYTKQLDGLYKIKQDKFRWQNPMSYFQVYGVLPDNVMTAMAAVSFKWLGTNGSSTLFNDDLAIQKTLKLKASATITAEQRNLVTYIGSSADYIGASLGQDVFNYLQIKLDNNAAVNLQEKIEKSLGLTMLANMQRMDLLTRTYVDYGTAKNIKPAKATQGLKGLMNKANSKHEEAINPATFIVNPKDIGTDKRKGKKAIDFFKIKTTGNLNKLTDANTLIKEDFINAKVFWEEIFGTKKDDAEISFDKPKVVSKQMPLTKSSEKSSVEQADNLQKSVAETPYVLAAQLANVLQALPIKVQKVLMGAKDISKAHVDNKISYEGTNNGVNRSLDNLSTWFKMAAQQPLKTATKFFIPALFQANNRMRQTGLIQTQNDKMMRALFVTEASLVKMDPTNAKEKERFMEAIALAFGIESSKEHNVQEVIDKTTTFLASEEVQAALKDIDSLLDLMDGIEHDPAMAEKAKDLDSVNIIAAVSAGKEKVHSLKGLIEYQKFIRANKEGKPFTTDIYAERDGLANGPTMMTVQLRTSPINAKLLGQLMSGGFVFQDEYAPDSHKQSFDPYESIGAVWGQKLAERRFSLAQGEGRGELDKVDIISNLIGGLYDNNGSMIKATRKLAKNMSVGAIYGAGKTSTNKGFTNYLIGEINTTLESFATIEDATVAYTKFLEFANRIDFLTDSKQAFVLNKEARYSGESEYLRYALTTQAKKNLTFNVKQNYGTALFEAIEDVYGDFREASVVLNKGVGLVVGRYNAVFRNRLKQIKGPVTKKELKAIKAELDLLLPRVITPIGGSLALYDFGNSELLPDNEDSQVVQSYLNKDLEKGAPYYVSGMKTEALNIQELVPTSVKPIPTIIHMLDSMVANMVMGKINGILNIHDAVIVGFKSAEEVAVLQNDIFLEVMKDFSVATAVQDAIATANDAFGKIDMSPELIKEVKESYKGSGLLDKKKGNQVVQISVQQADKDSIADIAEITKIVNKNKDTLLDSSVRMNQYFDYAGGFATGKKAQVNIDGVVVSDIKQTTSVLKELMAKDVVSSNDLVKKIVTPLELGSKKKSTLTEDKSTYSLIQEVNELNVLDVYDTIKSDSVVKDSATHDKHLRGLLSGMIRKVMQPIQLYMVKNGFAESEGKIVFNPDDKNDIFITSQTTQTGSSVINHGIRMSTGEVYSHELVHGISLHGLKTHEGLRSKVSVLYDLTLKAISKHYPKGDGFRLFLSNPSMNIMDQANAQEVKDAQDRFNYFLGTDQVRTTKSINPTTGIESNKRFSNHLEEFVAFGTTNETFGNFIGSVAMNRSKYTKSAWGDVKADNIQETLINIFQKLMDFWTGTLRRVKTESNVQNELMVLTARLGEVDSRYKNSIIDGVSTKLDPITKQVYDKGNQWIKNAFVNTPVLKIANGLRLVVETRKESDSLLGQLMRDLDAQWSSLDEGVVKSIITEGKSRTDRLSDLHQLLNRATVFVDGARTTMADTMQAVAAKSFLRNQTKENMLTQSESMAVTKAFLKTDATVLYKLLPKGRLLKVLQSTAELQKAVLDTIKEITDPKPADGVVLTKYADYYRAASDAAGHRMATGTGRKNEVYFRSTKVIVEGMNTSFAGDMSVEQLTKADNLVSKLTSLYALQYTPTDHKTTAAALMVEDPEGVNAVLSLHNHMKAEAKKKAFGDNEYLMEKGYTKELLNTRIQYQYGTLADAKVMEAAGYTRGEHPVGRDDADPTRKEPMYIYTSRTGRINDRMATIAGFQGNSAKGSSTRDLANQLDLTTAEGAKNKQEIIIAKKKLIEAMTKPGFAPGDVGNMMDPIVDGLGNITDYRYTMAESTKDNTLEKINDYEIILGAMAGQVLGKERSPIINKELVVSLKDLYDKEYKANPEAYLEIGPKSTDPKLKELYYLFPDQMKADIRKEWGSHSMMVAKDVMTLAFGYRQYSAIEAFTKNPKERKLFEKVMVQVFNSIAVPFGSNGVTVLNNAEQFASAVTSYAKNTIVVKTGFVTMANMGSNLMNLKMKGIPTMTILRKSREALVMGNKYQADKKKLDRVKLRLEVVKDQKGNTASLDNVIMRLENSIARNPTTEGIESGLMPSLMDNTDTSVGKTRHPHAIQKAVDKQVAKLHPMISGAGKALLMTEDTQIYRILNNAVKMTDFVGRHVLYNYNVETLGMDKAEAAAQAIEEFINFAPPTHQMIDYLNRMGVLWFTKYGIRVLKTMKNNAVAKPFDVLATLGMASAMGLDTIFGSIPGITKGLLSNVGNPVNMFTNSFTESATLANTDMVFETLFSK